MIWLLGTRQGPWIWVVLGTKTAAAVDVIKMNLEVCPLFHIHASHAGRHLRDIQILRHLPFHSHIEDIIICRRCEEMRREGPFFGPFHSQFASVANPKCEA